MGNKNNKKYIAKRKIARTLNECARIARASKSNETSCLELKNRVESSSKLLNLSAVPLFYKEKLTSLNNNNSDNITVHWADSPLPLHTSVDNEISEIKTSQDKDAFHNLQNPNTGQKKLQDENKKRKTKIQNAEKSGLYIDEKYPFLGATPDGITDDDSMVVEVKCPITAYKIGNIDAAIARKKVHFWKKDRDGQEYVNKKSDWYYQAQGQMHIAKKTKCLFAVWYGDQKLKVEILEKDEEFWRKEMEPKLVSFYMDCLLPELVDPRHPKKKTIRDPEYVTATSTKSSTSLVTSPIATRKNKESALAAIPPIKRRKINFNEF